MAEYEKRARDAGLKDIQVVIEMEILKPFWLKQSLIKNTLI